MVSTQARVGSINVLLSVQHGAAATGLNAFARTVENTGMRTQRAVGGIDRSVIGMNRSMRGISSNASGFRGLTISALRTRDSIGQLNSMLLATSALFGGLVPALSGVYFIRMADRAKLLENQLRTVTSGTEDLKNVNEQLFEVAQRTRSSFEATATIYARTARATEHFGYSQEKLLRIAETVQKAFAVGGANAAEALGAAIQLTQGIASDRFSGEEFRSVAENAPVLLRGIAESLGVNIGKLREMAHAGELTAKVITEAIVEASQRIDEEFAQTTSTIGQAMIKLDNAILKYVGNSENVSVASMGIVTAVNAVAENLDTVTDSLLLLGGALVSVMAGRPLNAIKGNIAAMGAHLAMVRQNTAATLQQTQVEAAASAQRLASARAYYAMVTQGNATEATRVRAARQLHAANVQNLASQKALVFATREHDAALRSASISGRAFAAAGRAGSAAWSFIGGPFGLALMAIGTAMYVVSSEAAKTNAELQRFSEAADNVQQMLAAIEGRAKATGDELARLAEGFRELVKVEGFARAQSEVNALEDSVGDMGRQLGELARQVSASSGDTGLGVQITLLTSKFRVGSISAEEYASSLQEIARANPDQSKLIADMVDLSGEIDAVNPKLAEMIRQVEELDGKEANVTIRFVPEGLVDGGIATKGNRPGASAMDLAADDAARNKALAGRIGWEEYFPDLFKDPKKGRSGGSRKDADDQFANSVQKIRDRIAALQEEQAALGLTFHAQERRKVALELEQEALKQVREEARRKGDQDWQNAELGPEQIAIINQVASAYADQALALKKAKEEQDALNDAGRDFGSLLGELTDGTLDWKDALLQASKIVLKLLNDMNLAGGGKGIFGGGFLQSLLGGFLGLAFHGGGTVGSGGSVVQFPTGVPYVGKAHSGRTIGSGNDHSEVMALLQKEETVFTKDQTGAIIDRLGAATSRMKEGRLHVTFGMASDGALNIMPEVRSVAMEEGEAAAGAVAKAVPSMVDARTGERQVRRIRPRGII